MERVTGVEPVSRPWQGRIIAVILYPRDKKYIIRLSYFYKFVPRLGAFDNSQISPAGFPFFGQKFQQRLVGLAVRGRGRYRHAQDIILPAQNFVLLGAGSEFNFDKFGHL